jgi:hypothetical protein
VLAQKYNMKIKSDADIDAAYKSSTLKKDRKDVIVAQVRATSPNKLEELWSIWSDKDSGLESKELSFAKSLVDFDAETPVAPPAPQGAPPAPAVS